MSGEVTRTRKGMSHPLDWCVEEGWEWDQVVRAIGVEEELRDGVALWDPCAGYGHMGSRLEAWGFGGRIHLSDLVQNVAWEDFEQPPEYFDADFLKIDAPPVTPVSIWSNFPYSYIPGIAEACVRQALKFATHRVVTLFPLKWLEGGKGRGPLFRFDHPPQKILVFTQRPSMPPGDMIEALGMDAHRKGQISYCSVVWDVRHPTAPGDTRTIWLPRLDEAGV